MHNRADTPELSYRRAEPWEMDWAYQIFKSGMQSYIEQTWGWNELFQQHSFQENIPASSFTIVSVNDVDIGGFCLKRKADHLYLEMLLIDSAWQRQGFGTRIMSQLLQQARTLEQPIRLRVLKANPAFAFYNGFGFSIEDEDSFSYQMLLNQ